jgi:hypothetical protein
VGVTPGSTTAGKNLADHATQYPADFFKRPKVGRCRLTI